VLLLDNVIISDYATGLGQIKASRMTDELTAAAAAAATTAMHHVSRRVREGTRETGRKRVLQSVCSL